MRKYSKVQRMIVNYECEASKKSIYVLDVLNKAVVNALDKKQKLGQYAVVWDREKNMPKKIKR